ncbi:imidazole glycerol phosphate synthase subunit HisH [bacterium]|nr:imidazole glycerol phosphate synthase subunit HisH [bacterium]
MTSLVVVDFGAGNVASMVKALRNVGGAPEIVTTPEAVSEAARVVVPGVGAFGAAMREVRKRGVDQAIQDAVARGVPVIGVCIGMQIFFDSSAETPGEKGIGIFKGACRRFSEKTPSGERLKVPQIGWNTVRPREGSRLFRGIEAGSSFYFVHSFFPVPEEPDVSAATSDYGVDYCCAAERGNVFAAQFHPEKSGPEGLALLANFLAS